MDLKTLEGTEWNLRRTFWAEAVGGHHACLCGGPVLSGKGLPWLPGFLDVMTGFARSERRSSMPAVAKQASQKEHLSLPWQVPEQR